MRVNFYSPENWTVETESDRHLYYLLPWNPHIVRENESFLSESFLIQIDSILLPRLSLFNNT
jgi:hypothetical protein